MACDSTNDSHFEAWPWIRIHLQNRKMSDIGVDVLSQFQVLKKPFGLASLLKVTITWEKKKKREKNQRSNYFSVDY